DAGPVGKYGYAVPLQQGGRPDARQLQQLWRADAACAQYHLFVRLDQHFLPTTTKPDALARQAAVVLPFDVQADHLGLRPKREIGARHAGGPQKGLGGVPAPAALLVDLEVAYAFIAALVEVVGGGNARLLGRLGEGVKDVPVQALLFYPPLAAIAVQGGKPAGIARLVVGWPGAIAVEPVMVFVGLEIGQAVFPAPGVVARQCSPVIVALGLATHIDHAVDAGTAAQGFAARIAQHAAVEALVGLGVVQPVGARVAYAIQIAHRDVDPVVVVFAAGLDQQNSIGRIGAEPVGLQATLGTRTHNQIIEFCLCHVFLLFVAINVATGRQKIHRVFQYVTRVFSRLARHAEAGLSLCSCRPSPSQKTKWSLPPYARRAPAAKTSTRYPAPSTCASPFPTRPCPGRSKNGCWPCATTASRPKAWW